MKAPRIKAALAAMAISISLTPTTQAVPTLSQLAEITTAAARLSAIPANKHALAEGTTQKVLKLQLFTDGVRLLNNALSIYNDRTVGLKYKLPWALTDAYMLVKHIKEYRAHNKNELSQLLDSMGQDAIDAELSKHLRNLRVTILPVVETLGALYAAMHSGKDDETSRKWSTIALSLSSLSRLASEYLVSKKGSLEEKLYLIGTIGNALAALYELTHAHATSVPLGDKKGINKPENATDVERKETEEEEQEKTNTQSNTNASSEENTDKTVSEANNDGEARINVKDLISLAMEKYPNYKKARGYKWLIQYFEKLAEENEGFITQTHINNADLKITNSNIGQFRKAIIDAFNEAKNK